MSLPQPERHSNDAPTFSWFHKTAPGIAPETVPPPLRTVPSPGRDDDHATRGDLHLVRPAPEPEKAAAPATGARPVRHLTWDEIQYFIDHDPDMFDEDLCRFAQWEMAIDSEPEIE